MASSGSKPPTRSSEPLEGEQKRAVETLEKRDAQLRAVIENLHSGVALVDSTGEFSIVNRRFLDIFGLPQDGSILDVNAQDWRAWRFYGEDGSLLGADAHPVGKAALTGQAVRNQAVAVQLPRGGELKWLLVSAEPLLAGDGSVDQLICTYQEISSLKHAEADARDAHQRLRAHVEATPLGLVEWDSEYRVKRFSRRAEQILGWTADEVIGRRMDEIPWIPEEDRPAIRELMRDMSSGAPPTNVSANRFLRRDGSTVFCEWYSSTIHDQAEHLASVLSLVLDVTARTRAEADLAESRKKLEAALASMTDAVFITSWSRRRRRSGRPTVARMSSWRCSATSCGTRSRPSATRRTSWSTSMATASRRPVPEESCAASSRRSSRASGPWPAPRAAWGWASPW